MNLKVLLKNSLKTTYLNFKNFIIYKVISTLLYETFIFKRVYLSNNLQKLQQGPGPVETD